MSAYSPSGWSDLFVATAGASAALAGLVFVAVSINIERILEFKDLPDRALATVLLLISVLLASIIGLIPGQKGLVVGIELLVEGVALGGLILLLEERSLKQRSGPPRSVLWRRTVIALGTSPLIIGGASMIVGSGGGLYWTVGGIVAAIAGAVVNAWVLLVEILR